MRSFEVKNVDCASCAAKIENHLVNKKLVEQVTINIATNKMVIENGDFNEIRDEIKKIESQVELSNGDTKPAEEKTVHNWKEIIIISVSILFLALGILLSDDSGFNSAVVLILISYLIAGYSTIVKAVKKILNKDYFDEHFLMTVATLGAVLIGEYSEAAAVMIFYRIGLYFEDLAFNRSRKSIKKLLEIAPLNANVVRDGKTLNVDPKEVKVGDTIIVRTGEKIPLDGIIEEGETYIDNSPLTGESLPVHSIKGDKVYAGTINQETLIKVKVESLYENSSIARVLELVENASSKKAATEKFITKFAKIYTPIVLGIAMLIAFVPPALFSGEVFSDWVYRALVILVVSCPCALVISIPLSYFGGLGKASGNGILIKGSNFIDILANTETIVFDKTGTLTKGKLSINKIEKYNGYSENEILRLAAMLESNSTHPIAKAVTLHYKGDFDPTELREVSEVKGRGISAKYEDNHIFVGSRNFMNDNKIEIKEAQAEGIDIFVAKNNELIGKIELNDSLKNDAVDTMSALKKQNIKSLYMLTGDNKKSAEMIANQLNIDACFADLLPEDKYSKLSEILATKKEGENVAYVGDGINDSPVIAAADVGIAMGGIGSDAAIESADVVIMDDSLPKISSAIDIARKTKKLVYQNISFALGVKAVFIMLGIFDVATMWEAVFGDIGVTLIVIFNSLRILR